MQIELIYLQSLMMYSGQIRETVIALEAAILFTSMLLMYFLIEHVLVEMVILQNI